MPDREIKITGSRAWPVRVPGGAIRNGTLVTYSVAGTGAFHVILDKEAPTLQDVQNAVTKALNHHDSLTGKSFKA